MNTDSRNTAEWLRRAAGAMAVSRVGLGVVALTRPATVTRAWVGPLGETHAGRLLGRALGGRDLVLGLGTLAALRRPAGPGADQAAWMGLAAVADGFDLLITVGYWDELPSRERWLIAASAGGAAALGLAAAATTGLTR